MKYDHKKVDYELVHQVSSEDVLICDSHIGLPALINKKLFDEKISDKLSDDEKRDFFLLYALSCTTSHGQDSLYEGNYVLKSVLSEIPHAKITRINEDLKNAVNNYYVDANDKLMLQGEFVDEQTEISLLKEMDRNDLIIPVHKKMNLSRFFEKNISLLTKKILYVTMFNDTNHPFYYKKDHEHVPGMMMIEAVRQAFYAYTYTFDKCKRGEVSISISTLNSNFYHYAQSNYPLTIMVEDASTGADPRDLKLKAKLFQRNRLIAEIFYSGTIMKLNLFKRLRIMGKDEESYMFHLIRKTNDTLILIPDDSACVYISQLKEISMKGMRLYSQNRKDLKINQKFKFILGIKDNIKIIASCVLLKKEDDENVIYVEFTDLNKEIIMKISDYIKNYTFINDQGLVI